MVCSKDTFIAWSYSENVMDDESGEGEKIN